MADFLVALAEFDRRRLWLDLGHASLFYFLHRELGLSKGAAHFRKTAVELVQKYPEVIEPLRDGKLCITSVVELAKVITPENRSDVLPRFFHCSKQEAKAISAELNPASAPPRREVVTVARPATSLLLAPPPPAAAPVEPVEPRFDLAQSVHPDEPRAPARERRDTAEPMTAELSRLHFTVSRRFLQKLEAARAALSHARPGATAEDILEAGLDLVLAQHAKRKGLVARPRKVAPPSKPDHVPAHVRRAVWTRDGGRCQWPVEGGGVCGSTLRVEHDHVIPRALGGPSTVENGRLLCRAHQDLAARRALGDAWMDRFTGPSSP